LLQQGSAASNPNVFFSSVPLSALGFPYPYNPFWRWRESAHFHCVCMLKIIHTQMKLEKRLDRDGKL
jgi:hypothetical protein